MMNSNHTGEILLVVDAQYGFQEALDGKTIRGIHKEIQKSLKNNHDVFYLEYNGFDDTLKELTTLSRGKHNFISKERMSGGVNVCTELTYKKLFPSKINVVGVLTDCCVVSTAIDLCKFFPGSEICVIKSGCNTLTPYFKWNKFWRYFLDYYPNLRVGD